MNKQDEENPLYRSRLVGQEIKRGSGFDEFFAAMPSLSALKMLLAIAVTSKLSDSTGQVPKTGTRKLLGFLDVKRTQKLLERSMSNHLVKERQHQMEILLVD